LRIKFNGFRPVQTLVDIISNIFVSEQRFSERTAIYCHLSQFSECLGTGV
jgi:hypothetical protein